MNLVPENINEAIKHLTGKTHKEQLESFNLSNEDIDNLLEFIDLMKLINIGVKIHESMPGLKTLYISFKFLDSSGEEMDFNPSGSSGIDHFSNEYGYSITYHQSDYNEIIKNAFSANALEKMDLNQPSWQPGFILEKYDNNKRKRLSEYINFKTAKEVFAFIVNLRYKSLDDEIKKLSDTLNKTREDLQKLNKVKTII